MGLGGKEDRDSASHFIECEKLVSDPGTDGLITPMNGGTVDLYSFLWTSFPSEEG